jgi:hypothetical protein
MAKIDTVVSHALFKLISPLLGIIILGLISIVWSQTMARSQENKVTIEKHYDTTFYQLTTKVDKEDFTRVLKLMERESDMRWESTVRINEKIDAIQKDITVIKENLSRRRL